MLSSQIQKKYTKLSPKAENGGLVGSSLLCPQHMGISKAATQEPGPDCSLEPGAWCKRASEQASKPDPWM